MVDVRMSSEATTYQTPIRPRQGIPVGKILLYVFLTFAAVVALVPFFWMISTSFMTLGETLQKRWLPSNLEWVNYQEAWEEAKFSAFFLNSVIISAATITGLLVVSILAAYAFASIRFVGRNLIFTLVLTTLMIPESVLLIPNFLTVSGNVFPLPELMSSWPVVSFSMDNSWINKLPALTVPFMGNAFSIFLLRQFFMQIPDELWDAARIDGCGHLRYLITVVLPLSRPVLLTVILLAFIASWNAFLWPLIVTDDETWRPVMVGLYRFQQEGGNMFHLQMAAAFITIMPMLVLYFMTQKTFTEGIATTGLKG